VFKGIINQKFEGHSIRFEKNEAAFAAHVDKEFVFVSNPYSETIQGYWKDCHIGRLEF
jgi:hypothetical protein